MKRLGGVYLVVDPKKDWKELLNKLKQALEGGVSIVQVWNHWADDLSPDEQLNFIRQIKQLAAQFEVPVLMNEDWQLALKADLDGVHFDQIPENWEAVKQQLESKIIGLTVGNDLERIQWAASQQLDYLSFCAMFPSPSVDSCEIVNSDSVLRARELMDLPLFLSGGIRPDNLHELKKLDFQGVAIISGIMSSGDPKSAVQAYVDQLVRLEKVKF